MRTATKHLQVFCVATVLACTLSAHASVVVTQIESRSFWSLWLFSDFFQQDRAHFMILNNHDVTAIPEFSAAALVGVEIVYLSPSLDELQLTADEIDVLEVFVAAGGRLIVAADYGVWADEFRTLAARFGVTYGESFINGVIQAVVEDFANPVTNGPNGRVSVFSGASHNDLLTSTNPDFRVLATWNSGPSSIGYLPHGAGEVVFLTDFNTWDNDMIDDFDNEDLWRNLFESEGCDPCDMDCDGRVNSLDIEPFLDLLFTGAEPCGYCTGDVNRDGNIDASDIELFLGCLFR